jgi:hypothetical protein
LINSPRYVLRVSVRVLGKEPIKGLEGEPFIVVDNTTVTVKQRWPFLVLVARDFSTEAEAEAFLPRIKRALWNIAIVNNIAFQPYFERRDITRPADPVLAARNLAKSFGQVAKEPIEPVHGLTEEEGYTIYESAENIRYVAMGQATGYVSTSWEAAKTTLAEGLQSGGSLEDVSDTSVGTAIHLYLAGFYETSIRARLLTLITCLEVLAPVTQRRGAVVQALSILKGHIEAQLQEVTEPEERDALEALLREIEFKKETSIRRRLRHLVLYEAPLSKADRISLAKKIVDAYDLRGAVVHKGRSDSNALYDAHDIVLSTAKLLLRARLGLQTPPPDEPAVAS